MRPISIIIVNWNSGGLLKECVESVLLYSSEIVEQIIVVDNASADNSMALLPTSSLITAIYNNTNKGFSAGCNVGYAASTGEFVLLLNPDARVLLGSLTKCLTYMNAHSNISVLGVRHLDEDGTVQPSCSRFPTFSDFITLSLGLDRIAPKLFRSPILMLDYDYNKEGVVDQVMGAFMFIRRSVIDQLSEFMDERFFVYFDDIDFSRRISVLGGVSFYQPAISIYHKGGGTTENIKATRLFYSIDSRLKYIRKYHGFVSSIVLSFFSLFFEPLSRIVNVILQRKGKETSEIIKGYSLIYKKLLLK